jgi:hypothetical protein
MTDFHTLDELIEARKLLAETSGLLRSITELTEEFWTDEIAQDCQSKIDAFLARPLYGKGE